MGRKYGKEVCRRMERFLVVCMRMLAWLGMCVCMYVYMCMCTYISTYMCGCHFNRLGIGRDGLPVGWKGC